MGLLKYGEANALFVIVDRFSKMAKFVATAMFPRDLKEELEIIL